MGGEQRLELAFPSRSAVQVERRLAQRDAKLFHVRRIDRVLLDESNVAVIMAWIGDADGQGRSAICSSSQRLPSSSVTASGCHRSNSWCRARRRGGEELAGCGEFFSAKSAAISPDSAPRHWWNLAVGVPTPRRCRRTGSRRSRRPRHRVGVEAEEPAHGGGAERAEDAGAVPAPSAERRIVAPIPIRVVASKPAAIAPGGRGRSGRRARRSRARAAPPPA